MFVHNSTTEVHYAPKEVQFNSKVVLEGIKILSIFKLVQIKLASKIRRL